MSTTTLELVAPLATHAAVIHEGVPMLGEEEARQIVKNINGRFEQSRKDLMELEDREGWRALGYESWRACVMAEFSQSVATLYRQLEAAKIEREIFGVSQVETPTPTSQLQAVRHLPTEQKRAAFKRADELAGDAPRTAKHVTQAAAEITAPDLPLEYAVIQRRLRTHATELSSQMQGQHRAYVTKRHGMTGVVTFEWADVLSKLERLEAQAAPTGDPLPPKLLALALSDLDARLPADLHQAGYYWQSAAPPIIANNDGWRGEAPTVDQALQLAYARVRQKGEPLTVFPALNEQECKALIREAKVFIERGLAREYPTLGQALRIAARMALEATEA